MLEGEGPNKEQIAREEGYKALMTEVDKSNLSQEAKDTLKDYICPISAFDPYFDAAHRGGLLLFEDTNRDGDRRVVIVDRHQQIGYWNLINYELKEGEKGKAVGGADYYKKGREMNGDLTEREVLEVEKAYSEEDPSVAFGDYGQERLDNLKKEAIEEDKSLHEN